jgi:hypothetical protein
VTRRPLVAVVLLLALVGAVVGLTVYGKKRVLNMGGFPDDPGQARRLRWNDFNVYAQAARTLEQPGLYERDMTPDRRRYIYPPLLACLLRPFTALGVTGIAVSWYVLTLVASGVGMWASVRIAAGPRAPPRDAAIAFGLAFAATFTYFDDNLRNGNANALVFALTSLGGLAFLRGRPWTGGIAFAAATALKLWPLIVLPWLVLRRSWTGVGAYAAGLVLWLVVVPSAVVGPSRNAELLGEYGDTFVGAWANATTRPDTGLGPPGFSLRPLLVRLFSAEDWPTPWNEPRIRVASLDPDLVRAMNWAGCGLILLVTALAWRRSGRARRLLGDADEGDTGPRDLSLLAAAAILVSPVSFRANFLALFLPAAWLAVWWWRGRGVPSARRVAVGALLAFFVLLYPLTDIGIVSREIAGIEFALTVLFLAPLSLWLACLLGGSDRSRSSS